MRREKSREREEDRGREVEREYIYVCVCVYEKESERVRVRALFRKEPYLDIVMARSSVRGEGHNKHLVPQVCFQQFQSCLCHEDVIVCEHDVMISHFHCE